MEAAAVERARTFDVKAELDEVRSHRLRVQQRVPHGRIDTRVAWSVERDVVLQIQAAGLSGGLYLGKVRGVKRLKVYVSYVQPVELPFNRLVHQLRQVHCLLKRVRSAKSPAFAKTAQVKCIGMHAKLNSLHNEITLPYICFIYIFQKV